MENAPGPIRITAIVIAMTRTGATCESDKAGGDEGRSEHAVPISARPIVRLVNTVRAPRMRAPPPRHMTTATDHNHEGPLSCFGTKAQPCKTAVTPTVALRIRSPVPGRPPTYLEKCPVNEVPRSLRCDQHR